MSTAEATLAVAEELCASVGVTNIKLADIAAELGIEPPSIYRHFDGLKGVIGGLAQVAVQAEIATFEGTAELPFADALRLHAENAFDLYVRRPGLARFLLADLAVPSGLQGFEHEASLALVRQLFGLERELLERGIAEGAIGEMSLTTFIAARVGPALVAIAYKDLQTPGSDVPIETVGKEYVETVMSGLMKRRSDN